jgi:dihydrolipoamide dehydrogenase
MDYDLIVIGSGPGGYVAAIRASQLKMKTAVIEKAEIGGICLNWGCIPTKSLLKSAQVMDYIKNATDYGISVEGSIKADFGAVIARSRNVAENMSKGVNFLFKKNNIEHIRVLAGLRAIIQLRWNQLKVKGSSLLLVILFLQPVPGQRNCRI